MLSTIITGVVCQISGISNAATLIDYVYSEQAYEDAEVSYIDYVYTEQAYEDGD